MAIWGFTGFDATDIGKIPQLFELSRVPSSNAVIATGRYGGQALNVIQVFGSDYYAGGYLNPGTIDTTIQGVDQQWLGTQIIAGTILALMDGVDLFPTSFTTMSTSLYLHADGTLSVYRGGNLLNQVSGTLLGSSSAGAVTLGPWNHIEWKVKIHASTGTVFVKVNGTTVINLTGVNTKGGGNNYAVSAIFVAMNNINSVSELFDNFFVLDTSASAPYNDILGAQKVTTQVSIANGTNINFTPLSAPNYSQINEMTGVACPDGDTSYNSSPASLTDLTDTFPITNYSAIGSQNAVQISLYAKSTLSSGTRQLNVSLFKSGITYQGSVTFNVINTSYQYYIDKSSFLLVDPASSTNWNANLLNSYEWGYTNVGNGVMDSIVVRISQMKIERLGSAFDPFVPNHPIWQQG